MFYTKRKKEKDIEFYAPIFEIQLKELDILYRCASFLRSYCVDELENKNRTNHYNSISVFLFGLVFKNKGERIYNIKRNNNLKLSDFLIKNKSYAENLYIYQEKEIESLFRENLENLKTIKSATKYTNSNFPYINQFNYIDEYHKAARYIEDKFSSNRNKKDDSQKNTRLFILSYFDQAFYNTLVKNNN